MCMHSDDSRRPASAVMPARMDRRLTSASNEPACRKTPLNSLPLYGRFSIARTYQPACAENHLCFIADKRSSVIGYPDAEPITESMPHLGHKAVSPVLPSNTLRSSIHSPIALGGNTDVQ